QFLSLWPCKRFINGLFPLEGTPCRRWPPVFLVLLRIETLVLTLEMLLRGIFGKPLTDGVLVLRRWTALPTRILRIPLRCLIRWTVAAFKAARRSAATVETTRRSAIAIKTALGPFISLSGTAVAVEAAEWSITTRCGTTIA